MYIEASLPHRNGDKARLLSPRYTDRQDMCVQFYYHMYGSGIGTLNVYVKVYINTILIRLFFFTYYKFIRHS